METLLENPTHAKEFAKNLGGVSVVLGTPVGKEDRNSETLRSMLLASDVANDAVYTWMGQYYEFDSWDELLGDEDRCKAMMANELLWRALSASGVAMGKTVATLAGLSCSAYDDMSAVAASSTAMAAVAASQTAMAAVAASYVAVAAVYGSAVAVDAVKTNETAWATLTGATSAVMGKAVAVLSGLNPDSYADMTAVASSSTAMAAVIANATALNAVVSSSTAMTAVASSQTAMAAVASSSTAMQALYNAADTTEPILKASSVAIDAFTAKSTTFSRRGTWGTGLNKPAFMLTMKCDYGSISSNRNFAQCGAYKLGTTRRQSDSITPNKEMPMYGWVSLVEAYFVDSNYTTTVRYITW